MKEGWFFFPLGCMFRAMGGIPVPKIKGSNLTDAMVSMFSHKKQMHLAVTPEGTRSYNTRWRKGFIYIAADAHVPIELGVIDYKHRCVIIKDTFLPTGNIVEDLSYIRSYYAKHKDAAKYTEKFALPD